jgi:hypothetical protein
MVICYECKRCGFKAHIRKNYEIHLKNKKICKSVYSGIDRSLLLEEFEIYKKNNLKCGIICNFAHSCTQIAHSCTQIAHSCTQNTSNINKYQCIYCSLLFSRKSSQVRHENIHCKLKNNHFQNQIYQLKAKIQNLEKTQLVTINNGLTTNNTNNNGDTNNNTLNNKIKADVRVNLYGKEHFSYITQEAVKRCHICPYDSIPRLASDIFFNKNHPENRNVNWANKKKPLMQILQRGDDGPEWVNKDKNWVLEDMNDKAYNIIDCEYQPLTTTLTEPQKIHYEKFQDDYDTHNKNTLKRLNKETERLILNYKLSGFT